MTDIICPLCGKPNPPDLNECKYCQAPLKTGGFIASTEGEGEVSQPPLFSGQTDKKEEPVTKPESLSSLEQAVPDWLKETEASFLEPSEPKSEEATPDQLSEQLDSLLNQPAPSPEPGIESIDDKWLASLLAEAGAGEAISLGPQEEGVEAQEPEGLSEEAVLGSEGRIEELPAIPTSPEEKPEWLTNLEASSKIKLEGGILAGQPEPIPSVPAETPEIKAPEPPEQPEWLTIPGNEPTEQPGWLTGQGAEPPEQPEWPTGEEVEPSEESHEAEEAPIAPAEIPGWLEALRPSGIATPTGPTEDVSGADIVTAGPLMGLRGVISAHPAAIRAQKPPTYSIKLRVTEEQQARVRMMEELLADEGKPKPLPSKPVITSRHIFRLIVAVILLLPILWMIVASRRQTSTPRPGNIPGVVDFTQRIEVLPEGTPVLIAFDYEAGFSGEMNIAITNVITQLMTKSTYLTLVATTPVGPALAESMIKSTSLELTGNAGPYPYYADLGYIPGGTMGLSGLASSPENILPYALDGNNVWAEAPLNAISTVKDFSAVIVITNDPDTARIWIEQVGPQLQSAGTPLLIITSSQAEPLIRPYYEATPTQVQGLIAGLAGGIAYAQTLGNTQQNGVWDAYSAGITISALIVLIGSIAGVVVKMLSVRNQNRET